MTEQQPASYSTFAYTYHKQVIAAGAALPAIGIVVVTLRFWTRVWKKSGLGVDDWLIIPALVYEKSHLELTQGLRAMIDSCVLLAWALASSLVGQGSRVLESCCKPYSGAEKHVVGYRSPPPPDPNPEAQATELLPGQGTLELVGQARRQNPIMISALEHD